VVELLLDSPSVQLLIDSAPQLDNLDNERTTCLHLAARNGHVDIIKYVSLSVWRSFWLEPRQLMFS